jgi:riboflavin kinase/FMN adenylyltransferase
VRSKALALNVYSSSEAYRGGPCVLTIGNFDGVHLGHHALIQKNLRTAQALGLESLVYTFEPHPRRVLQPDKHPPRIMSLDDKLHWLEDAGIAQVVVEQFDRAFSENPAAWFAEEIIARRLQAKSIVVGHDFRFGRGREGTAEGLRGFLPNTPVEGLEAVRLDDAIVSSSMIRECVASGDVNTAARMLGRPYFVRGTVVHGSARGRNLGFPTANLDLKSELVPGRGVYAVRVHLGEDCHDAVANLGVRPTFGRNQFCMEVHLLDRKGNLYEQDLRVDFIERIRAERQFESAEALVAQIAADIQQTREVLQR